MSESKNRGNKDGFRASWRSGLKYFGEYLLAITSLVLLSPLILIIVIIIKVSGKGPVIYSQDRVGKNGIPFSIYKFRSMKYDAESGNPLLSGLREDRITRLGRVMRKYRIDEIPNFINVLKGEMSIVGPRPERQYYIDQIIKIAPEYTEIQKVKPGITSWGQVKYGYATNVGEMVERLKFDLYYIRHQSLWLDIKIMFLTVGTVIKGKGL
jgi:lipopolysaccharide/colanic/teichoic acid biosynthesis glycosyltransferase